MVQHDKSTESFDQAIKNVEKTYQEYMAAVSKALTIAGCSYAKKNYCQNEIVEHNSLILTECKDAKRNI